MQRFCFVLAIALLAGSCKKDEPAPADCSPEPQPTIHTFQGNLGVNDNSAIIAQDNSIVVVGNLGQQLTLFSTNREGSEQWRSNFSVPVSGDASAVVQASSGDLFVCGETAGANPQALLVKCTANGDTMWSRTYGTPERDDARNIIATSDGNLLMVGTTEGFGSDPFGDLFLIKVTTDGDTLWMRSYPDADQEVPFHLMETSDGSYLITGTNEDNALPREMLLLKTDADGNQQWRSIVSGGSSEWKWGYSTVELSDGSFITAGHHTVNGRSQVLLVKTDASGTVLWERQMGASERSHIASSLRANINNTFTVSGHTFDVSTSTDQVFLMTFDADGTEHWVEHYGTYDNAEATNLLLEDNGNFIVVGDANGEITMWFMDSVGNQQ